MNQLDNLLSLAAMAPIFPLSVIGELKNAKMNNHSNSRVDILIPEIYTKEQQSISFFEMLFTYSELEGRINEFLSNWFSKMDIMGPIHDLFFNQLYSSQSNPVINFLNFIQALETYHIRRFTNEIDPPVLAQRLKELFSIYSFPIRSRHGSIDEFIKIVRDTRNYYTHYDPKLVSKAARGGALKGLVITLGLLVEAFILKEFGFEFTEIQKMQFTRKRLPFLF
jgi:hypothetical protein